MKVHSLSAQALQQKLNAEGLYLRTGGFVSRIQSSISSVADGIALMYGDYPLESTTDFADFHVSLRPPANLRRWVKQQVQFYFDGLTPFKPLAIEHAFPMLEWGLNWCVTSYTNRYLIFHAAVVEKHGYAMIMPGSPGSGKSTLCAALVNRGWRLLSDELTLVSLSDGSIIPLPRPVSLKNESIEVIRQFSSDVVIGRISHDTAKGTVAHMRVPTAHIERAAESARPAWVVFPKFVSGAALSLEPLSKGHGTIRLIDNSFNYSILSTKGFTSVTGLIDQCDCYDFKYSVLDEAVERFDSLAEARRDEVNGQND